MVTWVFPGKAGGGEGSDFGATTLGAIRAFCRFEGENGAMGWKSDLLDRCMMNQKRGPDVQEFDLFQGFDGVSDRT
jgi:hypothetical protein